MDWGLPLVLMVIDIKGSGRLENQMVRGVKHGLMERIMLGNLSMVNFMVKEN